MQEQVDSMRPAGLARLERTIGAARRTLDEIAGPQRAIDQASRIGGVVPGGIGSHRSIDYASRFGPEASGMAGARTVIDQASRIAGSNPAVHSRFGPDAASRFGPDAAGGINDVIDHARRIGGAVAGGPQRDPYFDWMKREEQQRRMHGLAGEQVAGVPFGPKSPKPSVYKTPAVLLPPARGRPEPADLGDLDLNCQGQPLTLNYVFPGDDVDLAVPVTGTVIFAGRAMVNGGYLTIVTIMLDDGTPVTRQHFRPDSK